jgi:hypothetical protein
MRSKHGLRLLWLCRTCDGIKMIAETIARYASHQDTTARRLRVLIASVPSAMQPDIWQASALSAIRTKRFMRRTNVRIRYAHIARSTAMMHDAKPTPICCACGSSKHQTSRSVDCSEYKCFDANAYNSTHFASMANLRSRLIGTK